MRLSVVPENQFYARQEGGINFADATRLFEVRPDVVFLRTVET